MAQSDSRHPRRRPFFGIICTSDQKRLFEVRTETAHNRLATWALCVLVAAAFAIAGEAAWYWPFGSDSGKAGKARLSELMEGASTAIDNAADFAADGKISEAIEEYRKALDELDKVELDNPERAATSEFASVRNKRAYVNAAIDSLLMAQARENAKAVAVTDTTALEKRVEARRKAKRGETPASSATGNTPAPPPASAQSQESAPPKIESQLESFLDRARSHEKDVQRKAARVKTETKIAELLKKDPSSRKARIMQAGLRMGEGDLAGAKSILKGVLGEDPENVSALNMFAVCLASEGDYAEADYALSRAMEANPSDYHAYYNMANLMMQATGDKDVARRHYEAGRGVGGPEDKAMEESFK